MKRIIYLLPATAWLIIIIIASLISSNNFKGLKIDSVLGIDKIVHLGIYCVLTFLLSWGYLKYKDQVLVDKKLIALFFLFSSGIGILMEVLQKHMTETRGFDNYDIIANIIGAFIGSVIFLIRFKQKLWT